MAMACVRDFLAPIGRLSRLCPVEEKSVAQVSVVNALV